MASRNRKLARKVAKALGRDDPLGRAAAFRVLDDQASEDWGHAVTLIELRHVVVDHASALRDVIQLLECGRIEGAVARLDGAVSALEQASAKQVRDTKAKLRREQIQKGKRSR
jgi:hypothetical protein